MQGPVIRELIFITCHGRPVANSDVDRLGICNFIKGVFRADFRQEGIALRRQCRILQSFFQPLGQRIVQFLVVAGMKQFRGCFHLMLEPLPAIPAKICVRQGGFRLLPKKEKLLVRSEALHVPLLHQSSHQGAKFLAFDIIDAAFAGHIAAGFSAVYLDIAQLLVAEPLGNVFAKDVPVIGRCAEIWRITHANHIADVNAPAVSIAGKAGFKLPRLFPPFH